MPQQYWPDITVDVLSYTTRADTFPYTYTSWLNVNFKGTENVFLPVETLIQSAFLVANATTWMFR